MSKLKQVSQGCLLLFVAGCILWGGCTYIPLDFSTVGCEEAVLTPFPDSYGFTILEETTGFEGTLVKNDPNSRIWRLEGVFTFPTKGYTVLEQKIVVRETWPEQVEITVYIRSPKVLSFVCSSNDNMPISAKITADTNAKFRMKMCFRPEPRCGCFE